MSSSFSSLLIITVFFWVIWTLPSAGAGNVTRVTIVTMTANSSDLDFGYWRAAPVIDVAIERLRHLYSDSLAFDYDVAVPNLTVKFLDITTHRPINMETCDQFEMYAAYAATKYHFNERLGPNPIPLFLGPACSGALNSVALLAKGWKIPVITNYGTSADTTFGLVNKDKFPTMTRLSPYLPEAALNFFVRIMRKFGWTNVSIICDPSLLTNPAAGAYPDCTYFYNQLTAIPGLLVQRFQDAFVVVTRTGTQNIKNDSLLNFTSTFEGIRYSSRDAVHLSLTGPRALAVMGMFDPRCLTAATFVGPWPEPGQCEELLMLCDDAFDLLQIYGPICNTKPCLTVSEVMYVSANDPANVKKSLDDLRSQTRRTSRASIRL